MIWTKPTAALVVLFMLSVTLAAALVQSVSALNAQSPDDELPEVTMVSPSGESPLRNTASRDEQFRKLVVGTWQDEYQGKRTMTLREDGKGTMIVELSGLKAMLVAPHLVFNMEWSVANGRLKKCSIDGEPAAQVGMILKTMGNTVDEPILELTEDRLLLLDRDGKTKYDWRRVP